MTILDSTDIRSSEKLGARFAARRQAMNLSVADMSAVTNIRAEYISAIERLDQDALPAIGYTLGYVRSYAKALGMDGGIAVKDYKADTAQTKIKLRDAPHLILPRQLRLPRGFMSALCVASAAILVTVWYGSQSEAIATPNPDVTISAQYTAQEPTAPTWQAGVYTLRTTAPSWIQIRDAQDRVEVNRIFVTGETWQGAIAAGFSVSVRDAGAVELYDGAELLGRLGAQGQPIADLKLSRDLPTADRP